MDSAEEEAQMNRYDALLGSSDSEPDSDADDDDAFMSRYAQFRGTEKVNLDDISSASASEADDNMSDDDDEEDDQSDDEQTDLKGQSTSESEAEKPAPKKTKKQPPPPRDTTFLPSLMGGYVSGSESASDVDVAAPKKRRGQRQRQAIAEKKYGAAARHLAKQKRAKGRDAGWDPRRGAVDPDGGGTPWKRGVGNPFRRQHDHSQSQAPAPPPPKPTKKDDEGPLHPSWEARKKAKQSLKNVAYAGQKVVFD